MVLRGLRDRGINGKADAVVFYDLATSWIDAMPVMSRSDANTVDAFNRFWIHEWSTPGMPKTIIENKVKLVLMARVSFYVKPGGHMPRHTLHLPVTDGNVLLAMRPLKDAGSSIDRATTRPAPGRLPTAVGSSFPRRQGGGDRPDRPGRRVNPSITGLLRGRVLPEEYPAAGPLPSALEMVHLSDGPE